MKFFQDGVDRNVVPDHFKIIIHELVNSMQLLRNEFMKEVIEDIESTDKRKQLLIP